MNKSILYATNTTSQPVISGDIVDFGNIIRKCGCAINLSGGNVMIEGAGYYDVETNITFVASGSGPETFTLLFDGVPIPGATSATSTGSTGTYSVTIPTVIRSSCCCETPLTCVVRGDNAIISSATITVTKVC